jgi:hypothetical protein
MLFDRVALEQATGELVGRHKAQRFAGFERVADLCCGIGGDALALAGISEVVAVDYSATRVAMASHNADVYGHPIEAVSGDVTFDLPSAAAAHVDPDRRPGGSRRHDAASAMPGFDVLERIVRHYQHVAIKLSPGTDLDALPFEGEIELISRQGQCKQAVVWTGRFARVHRRATVLPAGASIQADNREALTWPEPQVVEPGRILYEPDPAVIRANLVGPLARQIGAAPIDAQIAYLVNEQQVSTPLAAGFRILDVVPFSAKRLRSWLAEHGIGEVDIKTRGFAVRPEEIRRRLKLRGDQSATLLLTRIGDKPVSILAERLA